MEKSKIHKIKTCFYTPSGILDWTAGALLPPDAVGVPGMKAIPTPWDRTMERWIRTGDGASPCPRFDAFLSDVLGGDDAVRVFHEFVGHAATGYREFIEHFFRTVHQNECSVTRFYSLSICPL